jgi:CubicO group peptidase (beta-lactamase class C family)
MRAKKLLVAALVAATTLTTAGASAMASPDRPAPLPATGRFDQPRTGFAPSGTVLRQGKPSDVGLDPAPITAAEQALKNWTTTGGANGHPLFPGAVGLYAHDGVVVDKYAVGDALKYSDAAGDELPADQQLPMRTDTIFDMASISKLFTSITVMQLVEEGKVDITAPVVRYLPQFGVNGKSAVTIEQLMTHTSGFAPDPVPSLWAGYPDIPSRREAVLDSPLQNAPGTTYRYSDLNMLTLGILVETLTGKTLDTVVRERITEPLGMKDTSYNPPASKLQRIAAEEYESSPPRGLVWGSVHDENAWSLGGVAGHAGVFSTVDDLAVLAQTILNGGAYRGHRILRPGTVRQMLTDYNQAFPTDNHGLGFELDQTWYMGALASPVSAGHTGFTGTTLVIDPESRSIAILLTNHVHPIRTWGSVNPARELWATALARSMAVKPAAGRQDWFSDIGNSGTATLTTKPLDTRNGPLNVSYDAFVDAAEGDSLTLESSTDGVTWQAVPVSASGPGAPAGTVSALSGHGHRSWWRVTGAVGYSPQPVTLRWRYNTDKNYTGRGVSVDGIKVTHRGGIVLDGELPGISLDAVGWQLSSR